jgi:hypothetical protein
MLQFPNPRNSQNESINTLETPRGYDTSDDVTPFLAKWFFGGVLVCGGAAAYMLDPHLLREQYISVPADRERTLLADVQLSDDGKSYLITHFDGSTEEISAAGKDCAVMPISAHETPYMMRFNFQSTDRSPKRMFSPPSIKKGFIALGVPQQGYSSNSQEP